MLPLTPRQREILDYITGFVDSNDYSPSYREIAEHFNLSSTATIAEHIETLKTKGYLRDDLSGVRSLQIQAPEPRQEDLLHEMAIPLLGSIAAGLPIEAIRTNETIDIPRDMAGKKVFALKVRGDSMIEDGIMEGDYVIIEACDNPRNGDIVVALLDRDNVTLKRFYREKDHVRLQPANKKYKPIRVKKVVIQGRVKGVIRKFD
ncbi:MAG TPA: transcriptional repressor LexA [Patescibacteria group bacterium]